VGIQGLLNNCKVEDESVCHCSLKSHSSMITTSLPRIQIQKLLRKITCHDHNLRLSIPPLRCYMEINSISGQYLIKCQWACELSTHSSSYQKGLYISGEMTCWG